MVDLLARVAEWCTHSRKISQNCSQCSHTWAFLLAYYDLLSLNHWHDTQSSPLLLHLQENGTVERQNRTIGEMLQKTRYQCRLMIPCPVSLHELRTDRPRYHRLLAILPYISSLHTKIDHLPLFWKGARAPSTKERDGGDADQTRESGWNRAYAHCWPEERVHLPRGWGKHDSDELSGSFCHSPEGVIGFPVEYSRPRGLCIVSKSLLVIYLRTIHRRRPSSLRSWLLGLVGG